MTRMSETTEMTGPTLDPKAIQPKSDVSTRNADAPKGSITDHQIMFNEKTVHYTATADWMILRKREKPIAEMFFVHYAMKPEALETTTPRPITFIFNGGPGAASAYLHVGALGPQRVQFGPNGELPPPPSRLIDNDSSWLAFSDLVFIDPIGTGFSRTIDEAPTSATKPTESGGASAGAGDSAGGKENEEFFQLKRDLQALGEFISKFLSKNKLWTRPVYIAGESYGGFRVGKLARMLQEEYGVGLNGAILISPAMELSLLEGSDYDILMWSDLFPSLVAAAVHHGKSRLIPAKTEPEKFLKDVEHFTGTELIRLLAMGESVPTEERKAIVQKAADYLGLPFEVVDEKGGRISHIWFTRHLLKKEKQVCGLYDATIVAADPYPDRETFQGADPTLFSIDRVFSGGINSQLRETLQLETERHYHLLSMKVNMAWKIDTRQHAFESQVGATDDLRYAMSLNPYMKVFITHGLYDLVTPYFASDRLTSLMKLTPEQKKRLTVQHFHGGHMFYAWENSRRAFTTAMREFFASSH